MNFNSIQYLFINHYRKHCIFLHLRHYHELNLFVNPVDYRTNSTVLGTYNGICRDIQYKFESIAASISKMCPNLGYTLYYSWYPLHRGYAQIGSNMLPNFVFDIPAYYSGISSTVDLVLLLQNSG